MTFIYSHKLYVFPLREDKTLLITNIIILVTLHETGQMKFNLLIYA